MAVSTLKLSDGTVDIDFHSDNLQVVPGGVSFPPPELQRSYVASPFFDGDRLSSARYANRTITIRFIITAATVPAVLTQTRSIQRLLNDAKERFLLGHGATAYLEYQWGTTAGQSVYYDVNSGELILPDNFSSVYLWNNGLVVNARLVLNCKPFGRYANQTIATDTLENMDFGASHNYMDVTTTAAYGDVPARMAIEVSMGGAAGTPKMWVAKRSGTRQTDDLWIEGEDEDSTTNIIGGAHTVAFTDRADAACSGGNYLEVSVTPVGANIPANSDISRFNYDIATPPEGQFRVLIRCRVHEGVAGHHARMGWGFGWSYGDLTYAPTIANDELYVCAANNAWEILDLGIINIPLLASSDMAANNALQLRIHQFATDNSLAVGFAFLWDLDYIFLLPIDEGAVIIDDVAAADTVMVDGISDRAGVFITDGTSIEDFPDYVGIPFTLGRDSTRIYMLRDDLPAVTFTVDVTYQPQFLVA